MKKNKIITAVASLALAATLGVSALAGCNKGGHEHRYNWKIDREANCTQAGHRTGSCAVCGAVAEEDIAVDPAKHIYGEWEVTKKPDEQTKGTAVKTCTLNGEHTRSVTLPEITEEGTGYASDDITRPATSVKEGNRHFVFLDDEGAVEFDIELPKRGLENLEDAVLLGASTGHLVREAHGSYRQAIDSVENEISCYYGDDYIRIYEAGNNETFLYSHDNEGNIYGVEASGRDDNLVNPHATGNLNEKNMLGYGYAAGDGMIRTYGAEDTLLSYYEDSQAAGAVKFSSSFEFLPNGDAHGTFSYSRYNQPYFNRYTLDFVLDAETNVIKSLQLDTKIFRPYMIADTGDGIAVGEKLFDEDGDIIFAEIYPQDSQSNNLYEMAGSRPVMDGVKTAPDGTELLDRFGNTIPRPKPRGSGENYERQYYSDDHPEVSNRRLKYDEPTLKTESDVVPANPYPAEDMYVRSFDVSYRNAVIGENGVTIPSNSRVEFSLVNILPAGQASLDYDPILVYIRTATRDIFIDPLGGANDNEYRVSGGFLPGEGGNKISITARYAGELTLVIKPRSGSCERTVKLTIEKGAPDRESYMGQIYQYNDATGQERHIWTTVSSSQEIELYVGQPLYVRTAVPASEAAYVDTSFIAQILDSEIAATWNIENGVDLDGETVSRITPTQVSGADPYVIYLNSTKATNRVYVQLYIKVVEKPDMQAVLRGDYTARLQRVMLGNSASAATINVSVIPNQSNWRKGTIKILYEGGDFTEYGYDYDRNGVLTTEYSSGRSGDTLDFTFEVNEVYKLTVTHSLGLGDRQETVVLSKVAAE